MCEMSDLWHRRNFSCCAATLGSTRAYEVKALWAYSKRRYAHRTRRHSPTNEFSNSLEGSRISGWQAREAHHLHHGHHESLLGRAERGRRSKAIDVGAPDLTQRAARAFPVSSKPISAVISTSTPSAVPASSGSPSLRTIITDSSARRT